MGLFDFLKKGAGASGAVSDERMYSAAPGVVLVNPGSKVYHCERGGCGGVSIDAAKMTEKKAAAAGLSRCRRCDWHEFDREASRGKK